MTKKDEINQPDTGEQKSGNEETAGTETGGITESPNGTPPEAVKPEAEKPETAPQEAAKVSETPAEEQTEKEDSPADALSSETDVTAMRDSGKPAEKQEEPVRPDAETADTELPPSVASTQSGSEEKAGEETEEEPDALPETVSSAESVDFGEPAADTEPNETAAAEETESPEGSAPADDLTDENPGAFYAGLAEKAKELSTNSDWSYATSEFDNLYFLWGQGPDAGDTDLSSYRKEIDRLKEELNEKKRAHYEEQQQKRLLNLEKKKELLKQFRELLEAEKWSNTRDVDRIRNRWEQIRQVPAEEAEKLENSFQAFMRVFDEHKVDRLVKMKQQEEDNLSLKLMILERMEALSEGTDKETDWSELDKKLAEYLRQFRKIGRIPTEKNKEIWDRFYTAQDTFSGKRFQFDSRYRKEIEAFLVKKKKLIDEAEALIDSEDLADAARKVNKLHRRWKKIGNLPQKDENELWDRFKAATDAFNEKKSDNIDELREQEEENYTAKLALIRKAEELKESEEWEQTHKELQSLMETWKKAGPVPRRKSGKIWKQFKGAMDHFYDRRRDYFKEVKEERKDNLKEKQQVIDQLRELISHENPTEAVELAKPLQEEFKKAGYVPIKHKNRLWKEYREVCDEIYERFRTTRDVAQIVGKEKAQQFSADDLTDIKKKQQQAEQLSRQISKMSSELIQMKESLSYFKEGKKGNPLLDQARERIEKMEQKITSSEEQLRQAEMEIDKLKKGV